MLKRNQNSKNSSRKWINCKRLFRTQISNAGKPVKADLNMLSIGLSTTALLKLNLHCPFPFLISNKIAK